MLRGIYMLLWDTNSLRDNLQTAADVKNKRGPASLFPYIYLIDSYSTSFGVHLTTPSAPPPLRPSAPSILPTPPPPPYKRL